MNKFHNSKIYKITDNTNNQVYIGSTIKTLQQRLQGHKSAAKSYKEGRGCASKSIIDNGDYNIELLEHYPCENRKQLLIKEQEYIDKYDCINKVNSHTDPKERYLLNRDKILIKKREYDKKYIKCECGGGYCMSHRARHLKSLRCQEYFKNKNQNKISHIYSIMSDPMSIVNLIKKFCKERNIPLSDDELNHLEEKHGDNTYEELKEDPDYCTESSEESEDYNEDEMVVETITIGRTSDGFYKILG
jgi:acetone carboxylase gamma subunit